jgi:hypothetical protein
MRLNHPNNHHVIEDDILTAMHQDEAATLYPVGVQRPPGAWGTKAHGKLTAEQWDVILTKSAVVTLIRLWSDKREDDGDGADSDDDATGLPSTNINEDRWSSRKHMRNNLADIVKASLMANNHITSDAHAASYRAHNFRFFEVAAKIYPDFKMTPKNHIALHFDDFLRSYGPSRVYKVPGFERINYTMQSTETNRKRGTSWPFSPFLR